MFRDNDPADLAKKLARLLSTNRVKLQEMADRLAAHVQYRHDLNGLVDRMVEIFSHAI
jgi:hypothetical protein